MILYLSLSLYIYIYIYIYAHIYSPFGSAEGARWNGQAGWYIFPIYTTPIYKKSFFTKTYIFPVRRYIFTEKNTFPAQYETYRIICVSPYPYIYTYYDKALLIYRRQYILKKQAGWHSGARHGPLQDPLYVTSTTYPKIYIYIYIYIIIITIIIIITVMVRIIIIIIIDL